MQCSNGDKENDFMLGNAKGPMSENTINKALCMFGYDTKTEVCDHGYSALNELGRCFIEAIERQKAMAYGQLTCIRRSIWKPESK
ncbi:hypothetical protein AU512_05675 [Lonsdalea iberica]|uniref:Uncharacterized protein n=1 Tax=Lonsdalea iberica TaxID=1082703 RepID=A0ABX3XH13_9GAMM|nr:hypothetical protein AU512_05675 [Lonsdalea iberica]